MFWEPEALAWSHLLPPLHLPGIGSHSPLFPSPSQPKVALPKPPQHSCHLGQLLVMLREEVRSASSAPIGAWKLGQEGLVLGASSLASLNMVAIPIQADRATAHSAGDSELRTLPSRDGDIGGNDSPHHSSKF